MAKLSSGVFLQKTVVAATHFMAVCQEAQSGAMKLNFIQREHQRAYSNSKMATTKKQLELKPVFSIE